jgi:uncharacterized protein (TIGR03435 family)
MRTEFLYRSLTVTAQFLSRARQHAVTGNRELLALGMIARGSRLHERIEMLLARGREFSARASGARVAVSAAALLALMAAGSVAPRWIAFAQARPAFEVASVKMVKPGTHAEPSIETSPDSLTIRGTNLTGLLMWAYQIGNADEISGPDWRYTQDFDISAKSAGPVSTDQLRLMLQSLLEERLKLAVHREQKIVPLYSLVVGKSGVKLHEVQEEPRRGGRIGLEGGFFRFDMVNRISEFARLLPAFLDNRPVEDKTGLQGVYEISLRVELDENQRRQMPQAGQVFNGFGFAPAVLDAVEQMGLKLESAKGPVDFLIIDRAEKPDAN